MERLSIRSVPSLHKLFGDHFLIGAAVNPRTLDSQSELLHHHFNSLTAENEMKFVSLHPSEGEYRFEEADRLVSFARTNGMKVRGHTLVWHHRPPDWLFVNRDGTGTDRNTLLSRMKAHIATVMGRYKGDVYCWDVVNEAIPTEGPELLRPSKWLEIIGDDYIEKAFEFAHEADPKALLFYNDYSESYAPKREKLYTLLHTLKQKGVPVHGLGLQGHWNLTDPPIGDLRQAIERFASLGLQIQITELDISVYDHEDERTDLKAPTSAMITRQAERYEELFRLFIEYCDVITGVTFWGAGDDYTWLDEYPVSGRKDWPFLFDVEHKPKPSFWKVADIARSSLKRRSSP